MSPIEGQPPDLELKLLLALTHRLPRVRGPGAFAMVLKRFYLRRPRAAVTARILGQHMTLTPGDFLEGAVLFVPQLHDAEELEFLRKNVTAGDVVLDIGAHVGFYTLQLARQVGAAGRVIAIEADPDNATRLRNHLAVNNATNVIVVERGVADRSTTLMLGRCQSGNTGRHSFLNTLDANIEVRCEPLYDILKSSQAWPIAAAKIDIEGMEFRVLRRFLGEAPVDSWPRAIVIEFYPEWVELAGGDVIELLRQHGYRTVGRKHANFFLKLER